MPWSRSGRRPPRRSSMDSLGSMFRQFSECKQVCGRHTLMILSRILYPVLKIHYFVVSELHYLLNKAEQQQCFIHDSSIPSIFSSGVFYPMTIGHI